MLPAVTSKRNKPPGCGFAIALCSVGALLSIGALALFTISIWGESAGREVAAAYFVQGTELGLQETRVDPTKECRIVLFHTIESGWATPGRSPGLTNSRVTARIPYRLSIRTGGAVLHAAEGWLGLAPAAGTGGSTQRVTPFKLPAARTATGSEKKEFQPPDSGRIEIALLVGEDETYGGRILSGTRKLNDQVVTRQPALLGGGLLMFVAGPAMVVIGASMGLFVLLRKRDP